MTTPDIRWFDRLEGTNRTALALANEGEVGPLWVAAREQTAGRGRLDRDWVSPPGNLYASYLCPITPDMALPSLSLVVGLAVADTLDAVLAGAAPVTLKWPNDVLVAGRKVSGVLLEMTKGAVVIGIGINITSAPSGVRYPATAISDHIGMAPGPEDLLGRLDECLLARLAAWRQQGFDGALKSDWLARGPDVGTPLKVSMGSAVKTGTFGGVDDSGALVLVEPDGNTTLVSVGDVS